MSSYSNTLREQPRVSVVIPCYNHDQFVQESIQSVIDQDYENIELIIIDDGSKDKSIEVIKEMIHACEARFNRFEFRYRPNKGLSATLNEALKWCKGEFFFPLASDDVIYPEIIKKEVQILRSNPECGMCHSHAESINSKVDLSLYEEKELTFQELILKNQVYAPTAMLRKKVVDELKGFDESLYIEDWDLWLRLTYSGYKICFINEVLAYYREHDGNSYKNHLRMEVATDQILNKWKGNEFYDLAIKNEKLRRFDFYAEIDKLRALNYLFFSLKNIGERRVKVGLIKLFIPLNLMNFLRKIRRRN